jgi:hypothetical protein
MAKPRSSSRTVRHRGVRRNQPIPAKSAPTTVPLPQVARIMARHVAGESARSIARAEGRHRETVGKIIRNGSSEVSDYITGVHNELRDLAGVALDTLEHALARKGSGWLALRILEAVGAFPNPREERPAVVQGPTEPTPAEIREAKIRAFCAHFAKEAYERSTAFDAPLVDFDKDLHDGEAKSNGTAGSSGQCGTEHDTPSSGARRSIFDHKD